jgi:hypothetical protein
MKATHFIELFTGSHGNMFGTWPIKRIHETLSATEKNNLKTTCGGHTAPPDF